MIECTSTGAYLARGEWVPADGEALRALAALGFDAAAAAEAKKGTIAWGILQSHNTSGDEDNLKIKFDAMASHDITFVGIIQTARASGLEKFPLPYVLTNCHNSLCAVGGTINEDDHRFGLSAARPVGGQKVRRHLRAASSGRHPPVYAGEVRGLRQDDPGLRLPYPVRRAGHHGHRRGRRRAG